MRKLVEAYLGRPSKSDQYCSEGTQVFKPDRTRKSFIVFRKETLELSRPAVRDEQDGLAADLPGSMSHPRLSCKSSKVPARVHREVPGRDR